MKIRFKLFNIMTEKKNYTFHRKKKYMLHMIIFVFHITLQSQYYTFNNLYKIVHVKSEYIQLIIL